MNDTTAFIFFGTGPIAKRALETMHTRGVSPHIIVTSPDRPAGRGNVVTPSPVALWADMHQIETLKPEKLDELFYNQLAEVRENISATCFVVIDYGKFIPKRIIDLPERGILNMHPSLLPRLRGPSPIRSAILTDEKDTGITVMLLDQEMDHGPIVAQKKIAMPEWPMHGRDLDELLSKAGGELVAEILPLWARGEIEAREQNHDVATYTKIFEKEDGEIDLSADPYTNLLKIRAFEGWPGTYAYFLRGDKKIRVQILDAHMAGNKLMLDRVKPEGKGEMPYADFARSGIKAA